VRQVNSGGPTTPNPDWVEATLDVQVVAQVASGLEAFDLYSYNGNPTAPRANFLEMLALPINPEVYGDAPPDIVSVSYALCEAVSWKPFTPVVDIAERMLASVATTGMSYLVAAGDSGSSSCLHNGFDNQEVNPAYPSTSAWVTAVGGTSLTLAPDNSIAGESVWNDTLFPPPYFVAGSAGQVAPVCWLNVRHGRRGRAYRNQPSAPSQTSLYPQVQLLGGPSTAAWMFHHA
jgi:subtilase family serine protease